MSNHLTGTTYTTEKLTKNNLDDVARLYEAVYGKPAAPGFFQKKYNTAYTGKEYLGFIAYNENRIPVGYYGVIPCFLRYENKPVLSAQSADTMTHPQFRFKGLFVELSNLTFDLCRSENIRLIFGFPNQNSLHGAINKLGWKMAGTMECFMIPVKTFPLQKIASKFSFLKTYRLYKKWILHTYKTGLPGIAGSIDSEGLDGVYRDENYLAYKTYDDTYVIKIEQSLVWIKTGSACIIGDILLNGGSFDKVIRKIRKIASRLGLNQLQFQTSTGTTLHALFAEKYIPVPSFPVLFQDLDPGMQLDKFKFTFADIDIF